MLWQAEGGQRALFHTSARNVINISNGNICHHSPPDTLSYLHAWTNTDIFSVSELEFTVPAMHLQRGEELWNNNKRIHASGFTFEPGYSVLTPG